MTERRFYYKATCAKCGHVLRVENTSTFLDPFFLPEDCPGCLTGLSRYERFRSSTKLHRVCQELQRKPFKLFRPSTWFGEWVTIREDVS